MLLWTIKLDEQLTLNMPLSVGLNAIHCPAFLEEIQLKFFNFICLNATLPFEIYSEMKPAIMEDPFNFCFKRCTR
ncbi:hypothetical protein TNIN_296271 [Trichonephila inaurata madagascariensis]|uniref:Uncharacterized protein n=1 Tax=Trichonephila inaurata madagascariensis TaxID=2747483 RepID=A0A8X6MAW3_9ARAC|nr:hypothetical protein TNIN_296271 [Trichonephila inaurata madagascariensis]